MTRRPQKMKLPEYVVSDLERIKTEWGSRDGFAMYLHELKREGWRTTAIMEATGYTRQNLSRILKTHPYKRGSIDEYRDITGLGLCVPMAPRHVPEQPSQKPEPSPWVMQRLRQLYPISAKWRGGEKHGTETTLFLKLVLYSVEYENVSLYTIARKLGITPGGLNSRLVRHGYRPSEGKSQSRRPLKYVTGEPRQNATKTICKRGHPMSGENLAIRKGGARICRACEKIRTEKYRARKSSVLT